MCLLERCHGPRVQFQITIAHPKLEVNFEAIRFVACGLFQSLSSEFQILSEQLRIGILERETILSISAAQIEEHLIGSSSCQYLLELLNCLSIVLILHSLTTQAVM